MELPIKFKERMKSLDDYDDFIKSYDLPAFSGLRVNRRKDKDFTRFKAVCENAKKVSWCDSGFYIDKNIISGKHPFHFAGMLYFQEPSAMCAVSLLNFNKGDLVLDLCAAPGGKSTQAAENKDIVLVSNEIISKRSLVLSENVERMGFENVIVTNESPERLSEVYENLFDKIIIDAPCSGEGMFKKEPAALEAWSEEHIKACGVRQRKIIDSAMKMLSTGGEILYSTCTFSKEENDDNARYILDNYPYMKLIKEEHLYPHRVDGEGHYAALLRDSREKVKTTFKNCNYKYDSDTLKLYRSFEKEYLNVNLDGFFVSFGANLYLMPVKIPIDGIHIRRAGLHLGENKKGRFVPSQALAKHLDVSAFKNVLDYHFDDIKINKYLHGETLECDFNGFGVIAVDGLPLGWGKGTGGVFKNLFPKGLRLL